MSADEPPFLIDLAREAAFKIGALEVRPSTREVLLGERRQVLEPRIMQVLVALARRRGEVVARDELAAACWGGRIVSEDALNRAISGVRRVAETFGAFSVETVARVGYRLAETKAPRPRRWGPSFGRGVGASVFILLLMCAALGAWLLRDHIAPSPAKDRIAVLPFAVSPADTRAENFAVGLTDETLSVLSANQQLAVSRTEAESLRGPDRDRVARNLGVGLMMDGAVQSDGDRLRVRTHLNDAAEHVILWSRDFEGPADNPVALQAQVADVATDLASWALRARKYSRSKLDAPTMIAFLKASELMTNLGGAEGVAAAQQVTARAPDFAWGHSRLAFILASRGSGEEARIEAAHAIALDPHDATAYLALSVATPRAHWREREAMLARGLSADPDLSFASLFQARFLAQTGRLRDALPITQRAVALRPLFPGGNATLGALLVHAGRVTEGRSVLDEAAKTWPDNALTRFVRFQETLYVDDMDGALALIENPATHQGFIEPADIDMWRAVLMARKSRSPQAMQAVARHVRDAADRGAFPPGSAIDALSLLGDADGALAEAARFYAGPNEFGEDTTYLFIGPTQTLRYDPRFMALAARLGLADYWRSTGRWPDFCSEAGLPYDCKAETAKVSKSSLPGPRQTPPK